MARVERQTHDRRRLPRCKGEAQGGQTFATGGCVDAAGIRHRPARSRTLWGVQPESAVEAKATLATFKAGSGNYRGNKRKSANREFAEKQRQARLERPKALNMHATRPCLDADLFENQTSLAQRR